MPKGRPMTGSVERRGDSWRVRVRGNGVDVSRTYRGVTRQEAEARRVALMQEVGGVETASDAAMTLSDYYWGIFRDKPSVRGTRRAEATTRWYDDAMRRYVLPALGDVRLRDVTHAMVRRAIYAAGSPANCKRTLSAVLRSAYDDGLLEERPLDRRVPVHRDRRPQELPWSRFEAMAALEAAREAPADIELYCVLGLSGLRKEECLGVRPVDIREQSTYSVVTGEEVRTMTVSVCKRFTDADGWVDGAKNEFSVRTVPVLEAGRDRVRARLAELRAAAEAEGRVDEWAAGRLIPFTSSGYLRRWKRWCESAGLRPIPTNMLRHTSDTLMLTAGVGQDLSDRMHGRTEHTSTYGSYFRPDVAMMEEASRKVSDVLRRDA
uniref:hypothetical protein n=1 Tax=Parolsenella massiliensis TaxID=1871022 RepID=UPI0012FEB9D6|nr:hypothetical protein [Parolsenella massiliensis]